MPDDYFRTLELTNELIAQLERFVAGNLGHAELASWARSLAGRGQYWDEPFSANRTASFIVINAANATSVDVTGEPCLRKHDALDYIRQLRSGEPFVPVPRYVAGTRAPLAEFLALLRAPTERFIIPGIGWQEAAWVASPATGRRFMLRIHVEDVGPPPESRPTISTTTDGTSTEVLRDLLETLAIDVSDLTWLAEEFAQVMLPTWTLWRQDDNGCKAILSSFSGYRKARAALAQYESSFHKQTYWLEGPSP